LVIVSSKGKKTKNKTNRQTEKTNKKTKIKQNKNPKFKCNTVLVSPSASSPSSVIVSSKEEKKRKKKRVWRQLCECLAEIVAHLRAAVSQVLLEASLIADVRN
jgi:hypothetical protein